MLLLLHDGTSDGILAAVARALKLGAEAEIRPVAEWTPGLFASVERVATDEAGVDCLLAGLRAAASPAAARHVLRAAAAAEPALAEALVAYVREARARGGEVDTFHAHPAVARVHAASRAVGRELHRLEGFVRFRVLEAGALWAPVRPVHDLVRFLAWRLARRFTGERFIVEDLGRRRALAWDGRVLVPAAPIGREPRTGPGEEECRRLWRTFFRETAVPERRSRRRQGARLPRRYWQELVEME